MVGGGPVVVIGGDDFTKDLIWVCFVTYIHLLPTLRKLKTELKTTFRWHRDLKKTSETESNMISETPSPTSKSQEATVT